MERRDALRYLGTAVLAPLVAPLGPAERWELGRSLHGSLAAGAQAGRVLSPAQLAEVRALADFILPRTDTPGAVDVGAPEFVDLLLAEWYSDADRTGLLAGLDAFTLRCRTAHGVPFADLDAGLRTSFLTTIDGTRGEPATAEGAYGRVKEMIVFAFLTSEPIARIVNTTPIIPGRFDGCVPV
jgi:hypothetical protein